MTQEDYLRASVPVGTPKFSEIVNWENGSTAPLVLAPGAQFMNYLRTVSFLFSSDFAIPASHALRVDLYDNEVLNSTIISADTLAKLLMYGLQDIIGSDILLKINFQPFQPVSGGLLQKIKVLLTTNEGVEVPDGDIVGTMSVLNFYHTLGLSS